jgi:hypothetical protein
LAILVKPAVAVSGAETNVGRTAERHAAH